MIDVPTKIIKPRRFDIVLEMRGVTWRRIQFEVSPDQAGIGDEHETLEPPPLSGFGLPDPDALVGIAMRFQIAQKLHAVSDPHEPPDSINDRARDVVDLLLLRDLAAATGSPTPVGGPAGRDCGLRRTRGRRSTTRPATPNLAADHHRPQSLGDGLRPSRHLRRHRVDPGVRRGRGQLLDHPACGVMTTTAHYLGPPLPDIR